MKKLIIYFFFLIIANFNLFSQEIDMAKVTVDSIFYEYNQDILQFDLSVIKLHSSWNYWANGTFQIWFHDEQFDSLSVSDVTFNTEFTELVNLGNGAPAYIEDSMYFITPRLFENRISITVKGPKHTDLCQYLDFNDTIRIGRFYVQFNPDSYLPQKLHFKKGDDPAHEWYYYQALAYKKEESNDNEFIDDKYYNEQDNIEMENGTDRHVIYEIVNPLIPEMKLLSFWPEYAGNFKVRLRWITETESLHKGFLLERFLYPFGELMDTLNLPYDHLVGSWGTGLEPDTTLIFDPMHMVNGFDYTYTYDVVPMREERYFYRLLYTTMEDDTVELAIHHLDIPQVIIYDINASDNPFGDFSDNRTSILFKLEEDAYVTCKVYDLEGRLVETLLDNVKLNQGDNSIEFVAKPFSQQGLYEVVLIASPTVEMPIDIGRAVFKLQYLR